MTTRQRSAAKTPTVDDGLITLKQIGETISDRMQKRRMSGYQIWRDESRVASCAEVRDLPVVSNWAGDLAVSPNAAAQLIEEVCADIFGDEEERQRQRQAYADYVADFEESRKAFADAAWAETVSRRYDEELAWLREQGFFEHAKRLVAAKTVNGKTYATEAPYIHPLSPQGKHMATEARTAAREAWEAVNPPPAAFAEWLEAGEPDFKETKPKKTRIVERPESVGVARVVRLDKVTEE